MIVCKAAERSQITEGVFNVYTAIEKNSAISSAIARVHLKSKQQTHVKTHYNYTSNILYNISKLLTGTRNNFFDCYFTFQ
jgi:hypothetical protein